MDIAAAKGTAVGVTERPSTLRRAAEFSGSPGTAAYNAAHRRAAAGRTGSEKRFLVFCAAPEADARREQKDGLTRGERDGRADRGLAATPPASGDTVRAFVKLRVGGLHHPLGQDHPAAGPATVGRAASNAGAHQADGSGAGWFPLLEATPELMRRIKEVVLERWTSIEEFRLHPGDQL